MKCPTCEVVDLSMSERQGIGIPSVARRRNHFLATCSISIDLKRSVALSRTKANFSWKMLCSLRNGFAQTPIKHRCRNDCDPLAFSIYNIVGF